jgi:hypothetical protein
MVIARVGGKAPVVLWEFVYVPAQFIADPQDLGLVAAPHPHSSSVNNINAKSFIECMLGEFSCSKCEQSILVVSSMV